MTRTALLDQLHQQTAAATEAGTIADQYTTGTITRRELQDELLALHRAGASVRFLAAATGIPRGTLADHLNAASRR